MSILALFDAMAAGVPVLASNRCFVPEVIEDRQNGRLFGADDAMGFADAALDLPAHPRKRAALARRGREAIARRCSLDGAVGGYRTIIREAVARARDFGAAADARSGAIVSSRPGLSGRGDSTFGSRPKAGVTDGSACVAPA